MTPDEVFRCGLVQVPEGRQLFDRMTVEENLLMGAHRRRERCGFAADLDGSMSFSHSRRAPPPARGSMSGGEQQMCAMARGLMAAPRLLMVDEMSLGLAPVIVDQLLETPDKSAGRA